MKILTKGNYYGEKQLEFENKGIVLSEYDYRTHRTDWHYHENPYFMYILNGNVYDINKKRKTICAPGSLLLHNWDETHYNEKHSDFARGFHIEFERSWFNEKKLDVALWEGSQIVENPKMHLLLGKLYYEFKRQDEFSKISIDLLLLELCEASQSHRKATFSNKPLWVEDLRALLNENELEALDLKKLSLKLGVHPVHISRAVPKYFSDTLGNYMRQQKIKKAMGLILDYKYSLTEIAHICGFSDQSHFTRTFKSYFGATPKDFRSRLSC